jgi:hypothetical protein
MTPVDYLLTSFVAFAATAAWTLFIAARHAVDGFEDEFGFHLGVAPPITSLYPALGQSVYAPAELLRAVVPALPKRRRKRGTKPPMLPANLNVDDLRSGPAIKSQAGNVKNSQAAPGSGQAHNPPGSDQSSGT